MCSVRLAWVNKLSERRWRTVVLKAADVGVVLVPTDAVRPVCAHRLMRCSRAPSWAGRAELPIIADLARVLSLSTLITSYVRRTETRS